MPRTWCVSIHGADVTQTAHTLLVNGCLAPRLSALETLSFIIAAAAHDVGTLPPTLSSAWTCECPALNGAGLYFGRESQKTAGHPGVNNTFLVNTEDEEALLRNDCSVLEVRGATRNMRMSPRCASATPACVTCL